MKKRGHQFPAPSFLAILKNMFRYIIVFLSHLRPRLSITGEVKIDCINISERRRLVGTVISMMRYPIEDRGIYHSTNKPQKVYHAHSTLRLRLFSPNTYALASWAQILGVTGPCLASTCLVFMEYAYDITTSERCKRMREECDCP